jgi:hypothetical protein
MNNWDANLFNYYLHLSPPSVLPSQVEWLFPQQQKEVQDVLRQFLDKFYPDKEKRYLILGINPGRYGAGITGVNFTAAKQLKEFCGINNPFKGSELSAEFIYQMILDYGGVMKFYKKFVIGSVCPLGFVQHGKNLNYYDNKELLKTIEPFIVESIQQLTSFNIDRKKCFCIGGEKNFRYLLKLNERYQWFKEITPLPHPRFIMQYKRKLLKDYIRLYLEVLNGKQ